MQNKQKKQKRKECDFIKNLEYKFSNCHAIGYLHLVFRICSLDFDDSRVGSLVVVCHLT